MQASTARFAFKLGLWLHVVLAVFIVITVAQMAQTFQRITVFGTGNAGELSAGISNALHYAAIGFGFGLLGLGFFLIGVFWGKLRGRAVFWWGVVLALLWMVSQYRLPIIGFAVLVLFLFKRREFFESKEGMRAEPDH